MRHRKEMSGLGITVKALGGFLQLFIVTSAVVIETGHSTNEYPYLLFSTQQSIFKHILNGSSSTTSELLTPPSLGIVGLSYHLRLGSIYWANGQRLLPAILTARIDGSGVTQLISERLGEPADLEVDWINDRLYWVDRTLKEIGEYDLITGHRTAVLSMEEPDSNPSALALYPYPNYGWVYWSDENKLEKASVTGDDRTTLRSNLVCVNVLTIDYASVTIYWIDHCLYEIQSLRLDGDAATHSYPFTSFILFASGLVIRNDTFYWSDQDGIFERRNTTHASVQTVYDVPLGYRATGLQLIHSSVQPQAEDFIEIIAPQNSTSIFQCSPECVSGNCIPPGLCACNAGWRGSSCDIDVNECNRQNGRCEYECVNEIGSYHCACPEGYALSGDYHTCEDIDECSTEGEGPCQQICTNLLGSYTCDCQTGFTMDESGVNCVGIRHHTPVVPTRPMTPSTEVTHSTDDISLNSESETDSSTSSESSTSTEIYFATSVPLDLTTTQVSPTSSTSSSSERTNPSDTTTSSSSTENDAVFGSVTRGTDSQTMPTVHETSRTSISFGPRASQKPSQDATSTDVIPPTVSQGPSSKSDHTTTPRDSSPGTLASDGDRKASQTLSLTSQQTSQPPVAPTLHFPPVESSSEPQPRPTPDLEVEIALKKNGDRGRERTIIITTVTLATVCLIMAIVALLVAILVVKRKRLKSTGSFTPQQQRQTSMSLNLSVKRISSTFSYTTKP